MSEKLRHHSHEVEPTKTEKEHHKNAEKHLEHEAHKAKHEHKESIDKILDTIEKEAKSSETGQKHHLDHQKKTPTVLHVGSELKKRSLSDNIKNIQRELPAPQKVFSRVIHQPIVNAISEASANTIARPSGFLFAGLLSVITSLGLLIACRYYGYRYNFLIGLVALGVGFALGLLLDLLFSVFRKARPTN